MKKVIFIMFVIVGLVLNSTLVYARDVEKEQAYVNKLLADISKTKKIQKEFLSNRLRGTPQAMYVGFFIEPMKGKLTLKKSDSGYILTQIFTDDMTDERMEIKFLFSHPQKNELDVDPTTGNPIAPFTWIVLKRMTVNKKENSIYMKYIN